MNTDALTLFIDVVQRGSFAAVARERDLDPSTVSRAVALLEAELGFRLLQRTTRRLAPTEAGALYYERVQRLVEALERARSEALDTVAAPAGQLRVTASVAFGYQCLVPLLEPLRRAFPALAVELLLTDEVLDLIDQRIDLAIRLGPAPDANLVGTKLRATRYRVCASPAYVARHGALGHPGDLKERDCLLLTLKGYRSHWRFRSLRDPGAPVEEVAVGGSVVISNPLALHRAALAGLGPALLADWLVDADLDRGHLVDLLPHHRATATDFATAAWILYPSRAYIPRKTRALIDFLKEHVGGYRGD
ncbi:MAG: LysR substrate-binding domain-containing protein [Candidatus Competibacterales bacterium]